eukprot:SAG31_NODE_6004_length_2218_cov_1.061350_1_plen_220_part_10
MVTIADRDAEAGERLAQYLRTSGSPALFVDTDVTSEESVEAMVQATVSEFGRLDVLVNVAGVNIIAPLTETTLERWDTAQQVNLRSVFLAVRSSIPHMAAQGGGSVVSVSSIQGTRGFPNFPAYAATKAGMQGLTRQLAVDYAHQGIRFNTVSPGGIETALNANSQKLYPTLAPLGQDGKKIAESLPNSETEESGEAGLEPFDSSPRLFIRGLPVDVARV